MAVAAAACSGGPSVTAAPSASSSACSAALDRLPATVLDRARTPLDVAGAAAWGEPPVVLRCGLPALAPTTLPCQSVDDVDWVFDVSKDPLVATTFGRAPAVEISVPASLGTQSLSSAMVDVEPVARALPTNGRTCTAGTG